MSLINIIEKAKQEFIIIEVGRVMKLFVLTVDVDHVDSNRPAAGDWLDLL